MIQDVPSLPYLWGDGCMQGSNEALVQVPTYFEAIDAETVGGECESGQTGSFFTVKYQVLDQNGNAINQSGMTPEEHVTVNGEATFDGFRSFSTPSTTASDGTFNDLPVGACFTTTAQNFRVSTVQSFQLISGGNTFTISTTTGRRDCEYGQSLTTTGNASGKDHSYTQGHVN
jgi:hypothetical protein